MQMVRVVLSPGKSPIARYLGLRNVLWNVGTVRKRSTERTHSGVAVSGAAKAAVGFLE